MTPQQEGLLLKARRSIEAAQLLLDHEDTDFSVSRSYYAMFYLAEALLLGKGLEFSSHGAVLAALGKHFSAPGLIPRHVHQYLHRAFDARQIGDYRIPNEIAQDVAATQISRAKEFLAVVEELLRDRPAHPAPPS